MNSTSMNHASYARGSLRKSIAMVSSLALLLTGLVFSLSITYPGKANAEGVPDPGTGGSVGGNGGIGGASRYFWSMFYDVAEHDGDPPQGWGTDSVDFFANKFKASHKTSSTPRHFDEPLQTACRTALDEAVAKNPQASKARVVGLFMSVDNATGSGYWSLWGADRDQFKSKGREAWDQYSDRLYGYSDEALAVVKEAYINQIDSTASHVNPRLVCVALNDKEPNDPPKPPPPPTKTIDKHVYADSMVNTSIITTETGKGGEKLIISDKINGNGMDIILHENVKIMDGSSDITSKFKMSHQAGANVSSATIKATWTGSEKLPKEHTFKMYVKLKPSIPNGAVVEDEGSVKWNDEPDQETGKREFKTYKFKPNKSWVRYVNGNWQAVTDPEWTNKTGGDDFYYINGDKVASVVNGIAGKDFAEAPARFALVDNYAHAASILNDTDTVKNAKVYEIASPNSDDAPTVNDIVRNGKDVTSKFSIAADGTTVVATASKAYNESLKHKERATQVTLLLPFTVEFDTQKMLKEHGKKTGDELATCKNGPNSEFPSATYKNSGAEVINGDSRKTNEPKICVYIPPNDKEIVGADEMNSLDDNKENKTTTGNQFFQYRLRTKPQVDIGDKLNATITKVQFTDTYNELFTPERDSLVVLESDTGKVIPRRMYTVDWHDKQHKFIVAMTNDWIKQNSNAVPAIEIRVSGHIRMDYVNKKTLEQYLTKVVENDEYYELNGMLVPAVEVKVLPPDDKTHKDVTASAKSFISVNGKKAFMGDRLFYKVKLDAKLDNRAYPVIRLGISDDYDEKYLDVKAPDITVVEDGSNKDMTNHFNTQVKGGIVYVFAKTVDTPLAGSTIVLPGNPQPKDLKAYMFKKLDPRNDPAINQSLLGKTYTVVIPATVKKVTKGYEVKNRAMKVLNDSRRLTNIVKNPLTEIDPHKDVIVKLGDKSHNSKEIRKHHTFLYKLESSTIPANRVHPEVNRWMINDKLDTKHDKFTGRWAVYTDVDLVIGGKTVKAGERIAGTDFKLVTEQPMFTLTKKGEGDLTIASTDWANKNVYTVQKGDLKWTAYIQVERIAASERVENTLTEQFNRNNARSNLVWTHTPEDKPSIELIKFDKASGPVKGDRNTPKEALTVKDGKQDAQIVYRIKNNGDVPVGRLVLRDVVNTGKANLGSLKTPKGWDKVVLQPGEHVDVIGSVNGITGNHKNTATVEGNPVVPCKTDSYADPFSKEKADKPGKDADKPKDGKRFIACAERKFTDNKVGTNSATGDALKAVQAAHAKGASKPELEKLVNDKVVPTLDLATNSELNATEMVKAIIACLDVANNENTVNAPGTVKPDSASTDASSENADVCFDGDTRLTASDPWHAKREIPKLAKTGAAAGLLLVLSTLFTLVGASVMRKRRGSDAV